MDAFTWAHQQFWDSPLPDLRLNRRLVEIAACVRQNPCGTLPRSVANLAALKGAYRLLNHPEVSHQQILHAHVERTREACRQPGAYLLIEDTTALSFTQRATMAGMGILTHEGTQGLWVHTCLGMRIEQWAPRGHPEVTVAGVFGQDCWARPAPQGTRKQRKKTKRKTAEGSAVALESERWGRALRESGGPPQGTQWTLVADRECDIFEVLAQAKGFGADWIIRVAQARNTVTNEDVFEAIAQTAALTTYTITLRARPGVPARTAQVELRAAVRTLRPPAGQRARLEPLETGLVEVREIHPPEGVEPIHWLLFSSWPCSTIEQARQVCEGYSSRWLIEEYHKALKTGTSIEDSQLATAHGVEALLGIHAVVAAELLQLKLVANARPDEPITETTLPSESLHVLEMQYGRPAKGWTNRTLMDTIARMGGYLGRKSDGPPGWLSIWRGWLRLSIMTDGYLLAIGNQKCG